ncbi:MAG: thiamine pyrophosphate-dependent enzyme [Dehalococcoidales bacterium]
MPRLEKKPALKIKELSKKPDLLTGGHRLCAGCGAAVAIRQVLLAAEQPLVVATATGCVEVGTSVFPWSSWRVPWIHCAFENVAATISGVEAAYRAFRRQGKINKEVRFIAIGGDGGTYDIGLQSLSGALERGHRFLYICYNNEAYMNTGMQRSSATPMGASTTTTPVGRQVVGKPQFRKDLTGIVVAHDIPYVAQAAPSQWRDLMTKVQRALDTDGPSFINILASCDRGWRHDTADTIKITDLALQTCYWPLFEVINGEWRLNYKPKKKLPVIEWLKPQGRFAHLLKPENAPIVEQLQARLDEEWERLLKRCGQDPA